MTEAEVRAAIDSLFGETISDGGFTTLTSLVTELVTPGRAEMHRSAVLDELSA